MKSIHPFLLAGLAACLVVAAACKKSSSSSSSGGTAYTSYQGAWKLVSTATAFTGTCGPAGTVHPQEFFTVDSAGNWAMTDGTTTGTMNLVTGAVSGTITTPAACGNGTATGTCTSFTACSGTYSTTGGTFGGESGTWVTTR